MSVIRWLADLVGFSPAGLIGSVVAALLIGGGAWWFVDSAFTWRAERDAAQVEMRNAVKRNADLVIEHAREVADIKLQQIAEVNVLTVDAAVLPTIATLTEKVRHAPDAASPVSAEFDDALDRVLRIGSASPGSRPDGAPADPVQADGLRLRATPSTASARP